MSATSATHHYCDVRDSPDWVIDCLKWRGEVLNGVKSHWCHDWDGLPIDETCGEWPCVCASLGDDWWNCR